VNLNPVILSDEQRAAILTPGNVLIRAGAGSGKTEVLARRFVALVAGDIKDYPPLSPLQVAAITFTEKAAYDMRERIAAVLEERLQSERRGDLRTHLFTAHRQLTAARISTIHAFCGRILRENAIAAALDPDFEVLDEYESQTFLERVCREFLIDKVRRSDPAAAYLVRACGFHGRMMREGAVETVMRILDELARIGQTSQWLLEATSATAVRTAKGADRISQLAHQLVNLVEQLLRFSCSNERAAQKTAALRMRKDEFRQGITALDAKVEPERFALLREFCDCLPEARGQLAECVKSIKAIVRRCSTAYGLEGELVSLYGACRSVRRAQEVAALIREVAARIDEVKIKERLVTFNDLLFRTRQLLASKSDRRHRYKTELRELLIDEFQDTDQIQQQIVTLLVEPERDVPSPHLFAVGDEKQSIYRFRGADVGGFERIKRLEDLQIRELPLQGNRRSSPNIIAFVNGVGAKLMRASQSPPPAYWIQWGPEHELAPLRTSTLNPPVEVVIAVGESGIANLTLPQQPSSSSSALIAGNASNKRVLEARALASRIVELVDKELVTDPVSGAVRPVRYGDVVILLRAFTDVAIYETALLNAGIPAYTVKGRGFFGRQEILDLIELLTTVDNPSDSLALVAALRSPLFGLSDDCLTEIALCGVSANDGRQEPPSSSFSTAFFKAGPAFSWLSRGREDASRAWRILDELRGLRQRGAIAAVIEHALVATSYEAVLLGLPQGTQRVANVRKLVDLAREFESRRVFVFHDCVVYLRRLAEQQPYEPAAQILGEGENVVRLMTVHQAKGLEFPVVILADCGRKWETDSRRTVVDPQNGLLMCDTTGSGMDEIPNQLLDDFRERSRSEQDAESRRLLYVALTRARDRLIISEGAMVHGWAEQLRSFIGNEAYARFINSDRDQMLVECGNSRVLLMRPQPHKYSSESRVPKASSDDTSSIETLAAGRLAFKPSIAQELVISPTALADFERCPRQFHLRHNLKLPEIRTNGGGKSNSLVMGIVAHAVLERLHFSAKNEKEIFELTEHFGLAAGLDSTERRSIAADLAKCVGKLAAPSAREVPFFHHLGDGLFIRGQIDALIQQANRIIVRDYKYAAVSDVKPYRLPMEAYTLAVAAAYPQATIEAEIVFLKEPGKTVALALDPLPEIQRRILSLGHELIRAQSAGDFPKKPSSRCVCESLGCTFVDRCWPDETLRPRL